MTPATTSEVGRGFTTTVRDVPIDPALAEKLRRSSGKAERWLEERDRLILEARKAGGSSREIAAMVGLSHVQVLNIEKRLAGETDRD